MIAIWHALAACSIVCATVDQRAQKYAVVGLANTVIGLAAIYFGMYALKMDNISANVLGYCVGLIFSFSANKRWTFNHFGHVTIALTQFLIVTAIAYCVKSRGRHRPDRPCFIRSIYSPS